MQHALAALEHLARFAVAPGFDEEVYEAPIKLFSERVDFYRSGERFDGLGGSGVLNRH